MRDHREEARLGTACRLGLIPRVGERMLGDHAIGHIAADALHLAAGVGAHGDFTPGDPACAIGRGDLLVVDARAVRKDCGFALLFDRQRKRRADKLLAATPGEAAEGVVGVGDRAVAVAARDDVALRFEKAIGALLGFLEFPMTIFRRVKPAFELTKLCLHLPDARQHDAQAAARRPEQSGDTDREKLRIVM